MSSRYLLGPVSSGWAAEFLTNSITRRQCLTFDKDHLGEYHYSSTDSWESFQGQLPHDWTPDFLVLALGHASIPAWVWTAPIPIIGLASDWQLCWHYYRHCLPRCDLVLADAVGVEKLRRIGLDRVQHLPFFGLTHSEIQPPSSVRDLDIVFLGSLHPHLDAARLPWVSRIARLCQRWRIAFLGNEDVNAARDLSRRSRIAFSRSRQGEGHRLALESLAAGALLFQEADNQELLALFQNGKEVVFYNEENWEERLRHFLDNEPARCQMVEKAQSKLAHLRFESLWEQTLAQIEAAKEQIQEQAQQRGSLTPDFGFTERCWQALAGGNHHDHHLVRDLASALAANPHDEALHNQLGLIVARLSAGQGPITQHHAEATVEDFRRAVHANPFQVMSRLNLVEALVGMDQKDQAMDQARAALLMLERPGVEELLDVGHFPPGLDLFGIEWEKAAWSHAGDPLGESRAKCALIRWRLHLVLGELSGDLTHYHEAVLARPDLAVTRAALGCALGGKGNPRDAVPHLVAAFSRNPLDLGAGRGLYFALGQSELYPRQKEVARELACLGRVGLLRPEPWFDEAITWPGIPKAGLPLRLAWHGSFTGMHSSAQVNRAFCAKLIQGGHELTLGGPEEELAPPGLAASLRARWRASLTGPVDVHISHPWPSSFQPPPGGHWVVMQPWEFGSLPKAWQEPMARVVDEIWAPSAQVRECYLNSGIPPDQVHVIPWGVAPEFWLHPKRSFPLKTTKGFKFLYIGGAHFTMGFDLLLQAYSQAYSLRDDVCLVVMDRETWSGGGGSTAQDMIARFLAMPDAPEIECLESTLADEDLLDLYASCDCLVLPYRSEVFGLPIAEAMARGLPVMVTAHGAALDFARPDNAYLIPARVRVFQDNTINGMETVGQPFLAEPDLDALRHLLRRVPEKPEERRRKSIRGQETIRGEFTWERSALAVEQRLQALRQKPIRRLAKSAAAPLPHGGPAVKPRISLCMIVKNEEANLPSCLRSVADLVDEMVIVDTGSSDKTKEIARQFGARVFDFPWVDSFAAARNESLRHATGEWIFWMDADDVVDEENRTRLRNLFAGMPSANVAYVMKVLCLPDHVTGTATIVDHVRLFRNDPRIKWKYRVHEQILMAVREAGGDVRWADAVIHHTGYQDPGRRMPKLERDVRLLKLDQAETPHDPFTLFNLGWSHYEMGKSAEALPYLRQSLDHSQPADSIVRKIYALMIQSHNALGQSKEAMAICREGRQRCPDDAEILYEEGLLHASLDNLAAAEACLVILVERKPGIYFGSIDPSLRGAKARHHLAVVYHRQRRLAEAEHHWQGVLKERPDFVPSLLGLGELYLEQQRWQQVDLVIHQLDRIPAAAMETAVLRGRLAMARQDYVSARRLLEETCGQYPRAIWPRVILSHALLQTKDLSAAETALHEVLKLDPGNPQAIHNLSVLKEELAQIH